MDTNRLKRFATEARNMLMQGVVHRLTALGFLPDGSLTEEPQQQGGGATFMGDTVTQDFYNKWQSLRRAVSERKIEEVAEGAAYTWFNRLVAIRIMVKNGLASPVLEYESDDVLIVKNGFVTDTSFSNVVFRQDDRLFTPDTFLLNGCKRQELISKGTIEERKISLDDIKSYQCCYLINAMLDIEDNPFDVEIVF